MFRIAASFIFSIVTISAMAQWPKEIRTKGGAVINVYQPQPESLKGDNLTGRSAFSGSAKPGDELTFGVFWFTAKISTDRDARTATLESIEVMEIKLPGVVDTAVIGKIRTLLETEIPTWELTASLDDIVATIEQEEAYTEMVLKNDPPTIIYRTEPTTLVLIDGDPKIEDDKKLNMKRVINTPFLIVENPDDKKYYLFAGQLWYASSSVREGYTPSGKLPSKISTLDQEIKKQQAENKSPSSEKPTTPTPSAILVSTEPVELIQSRGQADYENITGTNLLYLSNSDDDVFKSISDQNYYVLISGRWYSSLKLEGPWVYIASDKLPADFGKIPEGSHKDNVLVSVAGTQASKDAIQDAQVPQTAKVNRKTATCKVSYDGEPKFEKIEGTSLELAMNTSSTVLKSGSTFYCVETGVWFASDKATGPWKVSDKRPEDVEKIPASSQAYNSKYVYVYDATPEVVYVGYTPGYMGCYVYGPTVVYGTGYYYNPWYGPYYYPRPVTYGFSMHYNPWTGWSMGVGFSVGFFSVGIYGHPGYWGPPMYRPPYYPPYRGGMYGGRGPTYINGDVNINRGNTNNIYNHRNDVTTSDVKRGEGSMGRSPSTMDQQRPSQGGQQRPANQPAQSPAGGRNNVYAGKDGSVYQRNDNGNWNQRDGNNWSQTQQPSTMNRDYDNRQRSAQQNSNYQQMNRGGNMGGSMNRGGGGGRRR